jgi:hypothetical protein
MPSSYWLRHRLRRLPPRRMASSSHPCDGHPIRCDSTLSQMPHAPGPQFKHPPSRRTIHMLLPRSSQWLSSQILEARGSSRLWQPSHLHQGAHPSTTNPTSAGTTDAQAMPQARSLYRRMGTIHCSSTIARQSPSPLLWLHPHPARHYYRIRRIHQHGADAVQQMALDQSQHQPTCVSKPQEPLPASYPPTVSTKPHRQLDSQLDQQLSSQGRTATPHGQAELIHLGTPSSAHMGQTLYRTPRPPRRPNSQSNLPHLRHCHRQPRSSSLSLH